MNFAFSSDFFSLLLLAVLYIGFVGLVAFNTWMIVDAGKKDKFVWMLFVVGVPLIGSFVYYFAEKKTDDALEKRHK